MSKTTFDPNAKASVIGESAPVEENGSTAKASSASPDSFVAVEGSKWKALKAGSPSDTMGIFGESELQNTDQFFSNFGQKVKYETDGGILGNNFAAPKLVTPFTIVCRKGPAANAYTDKFDEVTLPPSVSEAASLYSSNKDELKASIDESRAYYREYLDYNTARLENAAKTLKGGKVSTDDADILKQFVSKLTNAINFTNDQMKALDEFEKEKLGGKDI